MPNFYIVRLGKDSEEQIRAIDAIHGNLETPLNFEIRCKQVPANLVPGDFLFLWLGSNNNQGTPTDWKQGLRAFGQLRTRNGGPQYNDDQQLGLSILTILPKSVNHLDFLAHAPVAYFWISDVPVLGLNTHSNQTVQAIKNEERQNVRALFYSLEIISPGFKEDVVSKVPELLPLFAYTPSDPTSPQKEAASTSEEVVIENAPSSLPANWMLALASKGFILVSGPSGTGKSKTARDIAIAFDYPLNYAYTASHRAARPSNSLAFVSVGADWTDGSPLLGFRNMFGPPRTSTKDGAHTSNERWDPPVALRLILRALNKPDQPHFLVLDEMNLSHVERYFSEVLSLLEANRGLAASEKVTLLDSTSVRLIADTLAETKEFPLEAEVAQKLASTGQGLVLPENIFIVGTVNVDETTYMFSPKVLDRAHVLELAAPDPTIYLSNEQPLQDASLAMSDCVSMMQRAIVRRREGFWERQRPTELFENAMNVGWQDLQPAEVMAFVSKLLIGMQRLLSPVGFSFAYRTMNEVCSYLAVYLECSDSNLLANGEQQGWVNAVDRAILQKVLPKLHGNRRLLANALSSVESFLRGNATTYSVGPQEISIGETERLPSPLLLSADKIRSMAARLEATGYTTFVS
jgi:hypothetical protein